MANSDMYVVYKEGSKCVVSRRQGVGYSTPTPSPSQVATVIPNIEGLPERSWAKIKCSFKRPIQESPEFTSTTRFIWGIGPMSGNDIGFHESASQFPRAMNILSSEAVTGIALSEPYIKSKPDTYNLVLFSHGILFFLAWAVAPFIGIFIARYLKDLLGVWWYKLHLYIMFGITGGLSLISLILVVLYKQQGHLQTTHEVRNIENNF